MRTTQYKEKIHKISLFCKHAQNGFVVVEVNDLITKGEIIEDLLIEHRAITLFDFKTSLERIKTEELEKVVIVDTIGNGTHSLNCNEWAVNINYNRDLLVNLGCVVFICTTKLVNNLISFSSSFWSCVAVHVSFVEKLHCIYSPMYIESEYLYLERNDRKVYKKTVYDHINYDLNSKKFFSLHSHSRSAGNLKKYLNKIAENVKEWRDFYTQISRLGESFYRNRQYLNAVECYRAILEHDKNDELNIKLKIDLFFALAGAYYNLYDYYNSLGFLNLAREMSEKNSSVLSDYEEAILWNNIGVLFYLINISNLDTALSCVNESIRLLNEEDSGILLGQVLYNACLLNYQYGDYKQTKYYIDLANTIVYEESRTHNIIKSRFSVMKAFIMLSEGDYVNIISLMSDSLCYMRKELSEKHLYILEAHYTFSLIYLNLNMLERADSCIEKALETVKVIKPNQIVKLCVWWLYGIIKYYLNDITQAKNYLSLVRMNASGWENVNEILSIIDN